MDFHLLGPLEVWDRDHAVRIGEGRQRSLLAFLLLHHDEPIASERLIDALWEERPPRTAGKVLQNHIARLRRSLDDPGGALLQTHGHGYALHLDGGRLDIELFEGLVREGDAALADDDPARASQALTAALGLWRGPALADFGYETFARAEITRLEERRLAAIEHRVDADLALGRHATLVPELEGLVAEHPARERLRAQLMVALYRSGRQTDAIEAYRQGRVAMLDELGMEPGPALRELEGAILRQDPELLPGRDRWPTVGRREQRKALGLVIVGGALLVAAAIAAALLTGGNDTSEARARVPVRSVGAIDPVSGRVLGSVAVNGVPAPLAISGGRLYVATDTGTLTGVDVGRRRIADVIAPGGVHNAIAGRAGALWSTDVEHRVLRRFSTGYGTVVRRTTLPPPPTSGGASEIAVGGGAVWIVDGSPRLIRVDDRSGRLRRFDLHRPVGGVAYFAGAVWLISGPTATVLRFDARRGGAPAVITIAGRRSVASPYPIAIAAGLGAIWVLNGNTATVTRVDPVQLAPVATYAMGVERSPRRLAAGLGAVWVANGDGTLARIEPAGVAPPRFFAVAPGLNNVMTAGGAVWVSATEGPGAAASTVAAHQRPSVHPLPPSSCSPVLQQPGATPRLLIASDFPLQHAGADTGAPLAAAVQQVMREHAYRAGRHAIALQSCDDSVADPRLTGRGRCRANAAMYARDSSVVGVVGPFTSACAVAALPSLNAASSPIPLVSPSNTYVGLTRGGPGTAPGEPQRYAARGRRSYVRVVAADDVQGAADAVLAARLGARRAFVLRQPGPYGTGLAESFSLAARRLGVDVVGSAPLGDPRAALRRLRAARPDTVFLAGTVDPVAMQLLPRLRREAPAARRIIAPDGFLFPSVLRELGSATDGMYVTSAGRTVERLPPRGRRFAGTLSATIGGRPELYAVYAAQATEVLLDAIARSDGTRESVRRALFATRVRNGLVGDFSITSTGDTTERSVSVYRMRSGRIELRDVLRPSAALLRPGP
jgi:DNA-binding SARP family transcriptional activator/ABC-type branched-subunit amino acid transport system substrate-binding protein